MDLDFYDRTILLIGRPIPPASSWWVQPDDGCFVEAWKREQTRMRSQRLPRGVERALAEAERQGMYRR